MKPGENTAALLGDLTTEISSCKICGVSFAGNPDDCPSCSGSGPVRIIDSDDRLPTLKGYTFKRLLGEGGMGKVYLAQDTTLGRDVAIKFISREFARDAIKRERFLREGRAMATVLHPNIVSIFSLGEEGDQLFMVMEYVEGTPLDEMIEERAPVPVDEALRIVQKVVEALEAAWEKKIVHRDIKPANILLDRKNQVRVADFGLAKTIQMGDDSLTQDGYAVGTPRYLAPEQALGREVDFRTDMYSVGMVLYELLTGDCPFRGESPLDVIGKHLHEPLPDLAQVREGIPPEVKALVEALTQKEPEDRPASHKELLDRIDQVLTGPAPDSATASRKRPVEKAGIRAFPIKAALGAAVAVAALTAGLLMLRPEPPLQIEASLKAKTLTDEGTPATVDVSSATVLKYKDVFWIENVKANSDAYLYLFYVNNYGDLDTLLTDTTIPVARGKTYRIPEKDSWELDDNAGVETIFITASREKYEDTKLAEIMAKANSEVTQLASAGQTVRLRGVTRKVPARSTRMEQEHKIEQHLAETFTTVRRFGFIHE